MISKEEMRQLWPFYFYQFMRGVFFLTTITIFVFYTQEKSITYFQASLAIAFSQLTQIFSELVTGAVADTFGRKSSVVLSLILDAIIIFLVALSDSFWQIFVLLGLWGITTTLASGADQAWAVDSLIYEKRQHMLDWYYAKSRGFYNSGMIVAGLLSVSLLAFTNNTFLWYVRSALTFLLAVVLFFFAQEQFVRKKQLITESIQTTLRSAKEAIGLVSKHHIVRNISFAAFFFYLAGMFAESSAVQDFQLQAGIPFNYWGFIIAAATLIGVVLPTYAIKWSKRFKELKNYFIAVLIALVAIYALAYFTRNPFLAAGLVIGFFIIGDLYVPVEEKWINSLIPSKRRASILSFKSMIENLGVLLGIGISGFVVDKIGGATTITIASLLVIPAIVIFLSIKKKKTSKN